MEIAEEGILKVANVLIVSDRENYRVDAVNYRFANVDYFGSEICAYEYFRKYVRRFRAYDIIKWK